MKRDAPPLRVIIPVNAKESIRQCPIVNDFVPFVNPFVNDSSTILSFLSEKKNKKWVFFLVPKKSFFLSSQKSFFSYFYTDFFQIRFGTRCFRIISDKYLGRLL